MSVFTEPLAQVREALTRRGTGSFQFPPNEALAALDLIEQRAGEMEARCEQFDRYVETMIEPKLLAHAEAAEQRAADMEKALRDEFFRLLPDLDYEEIIPGSEDEDGIDPMFDWAWARHPWFALLGLTRNEIHDWFDLQNRAALSAREDTQ